MPYAVPAPHIAAIVDAPLTPAPYVSPGGAFVALVHAQAHPPVAMLARPYRALAGLRIDPVLGARRRLRRAGGLSVLATGDGRELFLDLPDEAQVGPPAWAPDGRRFAFTLDRADGVGVWVADAATGEAHPVPGLSVCDVLGGDPAGDGGAVRWSRDGRWLLVLAAPPGRRPPPPPPPEPRTGETSGLHVQVATYQDLLATPADEDAFESLAASTPCRADPRTGETTDLGPPGLYQSAQDSPDGRYLLMHRLTRPFSFRVPWFWFARRAEVWDWHGTLLAVVADLPPSEEVPRQGVPTGPRMVSWEERLPASLAWAEALDGGDPVRDAAHRDRVFRLAAPFTGKAEAVLDLRHRCLGWYDLETPGQLLLAEHDRDRRWQTTWLCDLTMPQDRRVVFDRSLDDAYGDPGSPLTVLNADGTRTVLGEGSAIYLLGDGATPAGKRPFFDRFDLATGTATRLRESPAGSVEYVLGFAAGAAGASDGGPPGRSDVIVWHEGPAESPNLFVAPVPSPARHGPGLRPLTAWPDPHPQLTGIEKRLVSCDRGDGVTLSGMLYLPPGHEPARDGRLPLVLWAYPYDFGGGDTAGQIRADTFGFTRLTALGAVVFVLAGYAVLANATMPVIGDPETMNDTYLEQIGAAAAAHVRALAGAGIIDASRVAVGGHSYGGFMTANLLAHTDLFAAGIARSGAYNRTLTPFGFQTERRSFWEAPGVYDRVSPFRYADRIKAPLLLIHGEQDANSGTYPIQSQRLYQAIAGNGGTARLVMLPHEGHAYLARESVLHVLAEEFGWLERWLGSPRAGEPGPGP